MKDRSEFIPELMVRLRYDVIKGTMFWLDRPVSDFNGDARYSAAIKKNWSARYLGKPAFDSKSASGHRFGRYKNIDMYAHHVIWALHNGYWPTKPVAHENGDPSDNRICNLTMKSQISVTRNQSLHADNNSGQSGVFQRKDTGKWVARIGREGTQDYRYLGGGFETFAEAALARQKAERELGYHDAHGQRPSRRSTPNKP